MVVEKVGVVAQPRDEVRIYKSADTRAISRSSNPDCFMYYYYLIIPIEIPNYQPRVLIVFCATGVAFIFTAAMYSCLFFFILNDVS